MAKGECRRRLWSAILGLLTLIAVGLLAGGCGGGSASPEVASIGSTTLASVSAAAQGGNKATDYLDAVKYAGCMRTHGVVNFPDPTSGGDFLFHSGKLNGSSGVNPNSAQFVSANKACQHLLPNGGQPTAAETQHIVAQTLKLAQCMRSHGVPNFPDPTVSNGNVSIRFGGAGNDPRSPQFRAANNACKQYSPGGFGLP
jgi:hypothetical protein